MDRPHTVSPELREKLKAAKEFLEECRQSGGNSRGGRSGRSGRGGHATNFSPNSSRGRSVNPEHRAPDCTLNSFSASPYTGRQGVRNAFPGNGGLSPGAGSVISTLAATTPVVSTVTWGENSSNVLPPYARMTRSVPVTSPPTPLEDRQPAITLRDVTNQPKRAASGDSSAEEPTKRARLQDPRGSQIQAPDPVITAPQQQQQQQQQHQKQSVWNESYSSDVNMADVAVVSGRNGREQRTTTRRHGGMSSSIWAQPSTVESLRPTAETFYPMREDGQGRMENWIPARFSHPNRTPVHLMAQNSQDEDVNMSGPDQTQASVPAIGPRSQTAARFESSSSTAPRRVGGRGGLADSKWAP